MGQNKSFRRHHGIRRDFRNLIPILQGIGRSHQELHTKISEELPKDEDTCDDEFEVFQLTVEEPSTEQDVIKIDMEVNMDEETELLKIVGENSEYSWRQPLRDSTDDNSMMKLRSSQLNKQDSVCKSHISIKEQSE